MRTPRFSIASLMTTVLVASLGLAALRAENQMWAGILTLTIRGLLALAVVGAICRRGADRAWWLGFLAFGWTYLKLADQSPHQLPTITLLDTIRTGLGGPDSTGIPRTIGFGDNRAVAPFEQIGHCLWGLLAATLGAFTARAIYARPGASPGGEVVSTRFLHRLRSGDWRRLATILALGFILIGAIAVTGPRARPGLWSGTIFFLTWILLGLVTLGAIFGRGRRRLTWVGAALFGLTYMQIIFSCPAWDRSPSRTIGDALVFNLREWLPPLSRQSIWDRRSIYAENEKILEALDQRIPMRFPNATPLSEVVAYLRATVRCSDGRKLPIYVDPVGIQESEKTMSSPIEIDLEDEPLRTSLDLALRQLTMTYEVKGGLLEITSQTTGEDHDGFLETYQDIGHCLLALIAAILGGLLAPLVAETRPNVESSRIQPEPEKVWTEA
ncbi:hypothetical protein [Singulisphaera sp. PoT]|uniref:hypothetical protein n=1 Tax=Singulisphaera sp. PoT TaxID=3411797 RepID=UPI003BF59FB0